MELVRFGLIFASTMKFIKQRYVQRDKKNPLIHEKQTKNGNVDQDSTITRPTRDRNSGASRSTLAQWLDVYLLIDEDSLVVQSNHEMNFRNCQKREHRYMDARRSDLEVLLKMIIEGGLAPSVQDRLIRWLVCGRLGCQLQ